MSINIDGQFNLSNFVHGIIKVNNQEGIFIPFEKNHLKKTEKGNVLIFWKAWPFKGKSIGENTHSLKHSVSKEIAAQLKEKGEYPTDLGFLKAEEWKASEQEPNTAPEYENLIIDTSAIKRHSNGSQEPTVDVPDDLPF